MVLHHDGYVEMRQKGNHKKSRNMDLLREKVELEPENLLVRLREFLLYPYVYAVTQNGRP